jgi:hypothetical protein
METKEFKIQVPEGYEIDRENSTFENIIFRKAERKLSKRWEDLPFVEGWFIDAKCRIIETGRLNTQEYNKNTFPTKEEAEACLALAQLCQLRDIYNEGWKPNWKDYNETKYCIEFCQGRIETIDRVNCHKILTFKTEDLRDKFLENFKDLIETAKPLL